MRPVVDVDFTTAQHAALRMLAACPEQPLSDHEFEEIVVSMRRLPPGPAMTDDEAASVACCLSRHELSPKLSPQPG